MHKLIARTSLILACSALFGAPALAQAKISAKLSVLGDYARADDTVGVRIEINASEDTKVSAGMLTGSMLECEVGGKTRSLGAGSNAKVAIKKGTRVVVDVPVALADVLKGQAMGSDVTEVKIKLPGVKGASASIKVVPDLKDVAMEDLDLTKTKVAIVTDFGTMVLGFRPDKAPKTVANFVKLAKSGFYDGTRYHRIMQGFMIQGGDPNTRDDNPGNDGQGGPGYMIDAEFNDMPHERGVISMARSSDPNSAGSQFFLMHGRAPHLDNQYTGFGKLVEGLEVLDRIANLAVTTSPGSMERSRPTQDVWLRRAIVLGVKKGGK